MVLVQHLTRLLKPNLILKHAILLGVVVLSSRASADVLFEGYSKILLDGTHVGYAIQRYEFDAKKQEYSTAYFLKTNAAGGNITESLKARANSSLKPISYQFTELVGDKPRTIDANFTMKTETSTSVEMVNGKKQNVKKKTTVQNMTAIVVENGKRQTITKAIPDGSFLSSFLAFVMLQGKEGLKTGTRYAYQAIAEEAASLHQGEAFISGEEAVAGINTFKVLNTFKGAQFVSYVTYKGEVIATRSPVQKISTELVSTAQEASAGMSFSSATISQIFGSVPRGSENPVSRRSASGAAAPAPVDSAKSLPAQPAPVPGESAKSFGVPAGQGIMIKGQPAPTPTEQGK